MIVKTFPYHNFEIKDPAAKIQECVNALYAKGFISLDNYSLSLRQGKNIHYLDHTDYPCPVFKAMDRDMTQKRTDDVYRFHSTVYDQAADVNGIVIGFPPYTFALLNCRLNIGFITSMLRNRGILNINDYICNQEEYQASHFGALIQKGMESAERFKMNHLLFIIEDSCVIACGQNVFEAITHYTNIEVNSRVEYLSRVTKTLLSPE